jgi:signal transduction histidine kinase
LDWKELSVRDRAGGQQVVRHEFEVSYPRPRFLRLYAAPLDGDAAGSAGVALILHDATEARQKTFEAIESERIQALTLLAASVAHEIGNPLNALHIHLQLMERELKKLKHVATELKRGSPAPARRPRSAMPAVGDETAEITGRLENYLTVAKGEITRLDYIVTQFLQAIRPTPPQKKLVSLNDIVRETIELLRPEIGNRGQSIEEKLARQLPSAPLDPAQIKQVLVNLIKNAMQAMTKGGVLTVETGSGAEGVWVSIADTGCGIPQEQLNRIFDPFFTTKKKGSGLGLMIVQRIVREHGGLIKLESHLGQGTTFRIWLPWHVRQPRLLEARWHD